jgi:hypothetical protein
MTTRPDPSIIEVAGWAREARLELCAGALFALAYQLNVVQATMRKGKRDLRLRLIRQCWANVQHFLSAN